MSTPLPNKVEQLNRLNMTRKDYTGGNSTLCNGCGHDAITNHIVSAFFQSGVDQQKVAKFSGIGCSSKTPAYFLGRAHGINFVHGRMPAIATGAMLANRQLLSIGVSGDGDTASIGLGQFAHMVRRNLPMIYIIENNGVYGLTKGQFSATADLGSVQKKGAENIFAPIDCCQLAIMLGCGFVARSFSGDAKQMVPLLKAAIAHKGTSVIDVVSPCVTFNDHDGSTKSYSFVKTHDTPLHEMGFVPSEEQIQADYEPGTTHLVELHDGSKLMLKKLGTDYVPNSREEALKLIETGKREKVLTTGLLYHSKELPTFMDTLQMIDEPLATLPQERVRPPKSVLDSVMQELM